MEKDIFTYESYRKYLNEFILAKPNKGRGWGARIATYLECHTSFVSQMLSGKVDLSLEQGFRLTSLLALSKEESEVFVLLLSKERAGTHELKQYYQSKILEIQEARRQIVNRVGRTSQLSLQNQVRYYSSWQYAVIHVLTSIPKFQEKEAIARAVGFSPSRTSEWLNDLVEMGLVANSHGKWKRTEKQLHLPNQSPMIKKHHQNWRLKSLDSIDDPKTHDMHYSSIIGISRKDAPRVREALLAAINSVRTVVRDSAEEGVYCYNLDFFEVI